MVVVEGKVGIERVSQSVENYRMNMAYKAKEIRYVLRSVEGCKLVVQPRDFVMLSSCVAPASRRTLLAWWVLPQEPEAMSGKHRPVRHVTVLLGHCDNNISDTIIIKALLTLAETWTWT